MIRKPHLFVVVTLSWLILPTNESAARETLWKAFGPVEPAVEAALSDWYENEYLPNLDSKEHLLRSRFARVDAGELDRRFKDSLITSERFGRNSRGMLVHPKPLEVSPTDIVLDMFPGASYRIAVFRHDVGSNNGMSMVRSWIMQTGFTGREKVYFEIKRSGSITAVFLANPRMYYVRSTPTDGVVVISEYDYESYHKSNARRLD